MFAIMINEKGGEAKRLEFDKPEVTIGRVQGNDIILPKGNVSKRHSRIVLKDGKFIIVDLKSTNGTYVNGRKITSPLVIKGSDKVYIGDFILSVEDQLADAPADMSPPPMPPPAPRRSTMPPPPPAPKPQARPAPVAPPEADGGMDDFDPPPPADPMAAGDGGADDDLPAPPMAEPEPPPEPPPPRPEPRARPMVTSPAVSRPAPVAAPPRSDQNSRPTMQGDAVPVSSSRPPAARAPAPAPVAARPPAAAPAPARRPSTPAIAPAATSPAPPRRAAPPVALFVDEAKRGPISEAMRQLSARLWAQLNLETRERQELSDPALWARAENAVQEMVDGDGALPPNVDRDAVAKDVVAEALGLGPLEELLAEEGVREIAVPRHDRIFVDRDGQVTVADKWFSSPEAVAKVVDRLTGGAAARGGLIEARLTDGTLVTAAVAPLAHGAVLTLRKPRKEGITLADLVQRGMLSQNMADALTLAVEVRRNIVVSGTPGSGRSTLLAALANAGADGERVITVEEAEELQLRHGHWVQLTSRDGGMREAVASALRLRPERLVVGDVRGVEARTILEAAIGQPGVLTSLFGTSVADALARFEALASLGATNGHSMRDAVNRTLHVVVQTARGADGVRRVTQMSEVSAGSDGRAEIADIFLATPDGRFTGTGHVPAFAEGASPSLFRA